MSAAKERTEAPTKPADDTQNRQQTIRIFASFYESFDLRWFALLAALKINRHRREEHHDRKALDSESFVPFNPLIFPADVSGN